MAIGGGSGGGRGASDVRAGGAWYEIYAKDGLSGVLDKLKHKTERFAASMRHVGGVLMGGGLALGAAPFASMLEGIEKLGAIKELTEMFGLSAEGASKMAYAFSVAGLEAGDLEKVFKELAKTNNTGKPLDEYMLDVADSLNAIENPSERARKAMEMFGKQGLNVLRILDDIHGLYGEAPMFSMKDLENAKKIGMEWGKIKYAFASAMVPLFEYLAPIIKLVAEFARENSGLLLIVGGLAVGITALGVTFFATGAAISGTIAIISGVAAVIGFILTPIGLVIAGITALGATALILAVEWKSMGEAFGLTWGGILDSVKAGNLELAFQIVATGVRTIWAQLILDLRKGWNSFIVWLIEGLKKNPWILPLVGGIAGGAIGGPLGAGIGATAGAGAALAIEAWERELKAALELGVGPQETRLRELLAELQRLRAQAAAGVPIGSDKQPGRFQAATEMVRGGFGSDRAQQVYGYGDKATGLALLTDLRNEVKDELPKNIATAIMIAMAVR